MKKQTPKRKTEAKILKTETVHEPGAIYEPGTSSRTVTDLYTKGVTKPGEFTPEEFKTLIAKAEAGPFYTLEEMDRDFDAWEKEFLKKQGISQ